MITKLSLRTVLVLTLFALFAWVGGPAAHAADSALPDAPAISSEEPASPDVPADGFDLFQPKPTPLCKAGWCSSNEQCEIWFGPGWVCEIGAGQSCGWCVA